MGFPEMSKEYFARLIDHMAWADQRTLASLRSISDPPARAVELFAHIIGAEHVWLSRVSSTTSPVTTWPSLTLDDAERLSKQSIDGFRRVVSSLTAERLQQPVTYLNSAGDRFTSTIEDILTHVAMHGSYHRGQIAAAVRGAGGTPSPTDYIAFTRGSPAATRQR